MAEPTRSASTDFSAGSEGAAETISRLHYCFGAKCNDLSVFYTCTNIETFSCFCLSINVTMV